MSELVYLTEQEAADLIGYHPGTLSNWRSAGLGPPYLRLRTGAIRYLQTDLVAWMERDRVDPSASTTG